MEIPEHVLKSMKEVRDSGKVNMMDRKGVALLMKDFESAMWILYDHPRQYMEALMEMGEKYG